MDDKEILIRQSVLLEKIGEKVNAIENKVNLMNDGHVMKTESRLAVSEEKTAKLEKIVYGALGIIFIEMLSIVVLWLKKT